MATVQSPVVVPLWTSCSTHREAPWVTFLGLFAFGILSVHHQLKKIHSRLEAEREVDGGHLEKGPEERVPSLTHDQTTSTLTVTPHFTFCFDSRRFASCLLQIHRKSPLAGLEK